jgi:hypothetical protein
VACVLLFFLFAVVVRHLRHHTTTRSVAWLRSGLAALLGIAAMGTNEPLMAGTLVVLTAAGVTALRHRHRRAARLLLGLLALLMMAATVSVIAPGNTGRAEAISSSTGSSFVPSTFASLAFTGIMLKRVLLDPAILAGLLLFVPLASRSVENWVWRTGLTWWHILLSLLVWLAATAATVFPFYWAFGGPEGSSLPEMVYRWVTVAPPFPRIQNVTYVFVLLGAAWHTCLAVALYWNRAGESPQLPPWVRAAATLTLILALVTSGNLAPAMRDLVWNGPRFSKQLQAREAKIQRALAEGQEDLVLETFLSPHRFPGSVMLYCDLTRDPDHWANQGLARVLGVRSVRSPDAPEGR